MPWISHHNCHEKRPRREPDITRRKCCEKLAATRHIRSLFGKMRKTAVCSAVDRKSQATSPRAGPPPSRPGRGGAGGGGLVRWFQRPTWLPAVERRERAGGPGLSCRARAAASHIHRMFVLLPQRPRQGPAAYIPRGCGQAGAGPLSAVGCRGRCALYPHPRKHAVWGA